MRLSTILLIYAAILFAGYMAGRRKATGFAFTHGSMTALHSLPVYYGANAFLKAIVPAAGVILVWLLAQPLIIDNRVSQMIPDSDIREGATRSLLMSEVRRTADGIGNAVRAGLLDDDTARDAGADAADMTATLKEAGLELGLVTEEQFAEWIVPSEMIKPRA